LRFQTLRFVQREILSMPDASVKPGSDLSGFTRSEYDINGVRTVVQSIGSGPVLVFLHGTGTFTGFDVARAWAAHHTVLIPFHPGFGDSGDSDAIDTVEDHVLHYMDLFDRLGLKDFDLAGFSLGGWLAAEFAIRPPQRLRRLVLVAPAGLVVDAAPAPGLFDIAPQDLPAYLAHDPLAALRYFPRAPDPSFEARLGREVTGFAKLIRNNPQGNPKLSHWLHRITIPTLVLWGGNDRLRPTAQAQAWMAGLSDGHLQLVPATGHLVFEETPDAGRHVTDFLAG
jgi:pimeloyl-ACP methyl ester carboxylesterase